MQILYFMLDLIVILGKKLNINLFRGVNNSLPFLYIISIRVREEVRELIGEIILVILTLSLIGISFYFRGVKGLNQVINYWLNKRG